MGERKLKEKEKTNRKEETQEQAVEAKARQCKAIHVNHS